MKISCLNDHEKYFIWRKIRGKSGKGSVQPTHTLLYLPRQWYACKDSSSCEIHAKMRPCALLFWPWFWWRESGRCEPGCTYKSCAHRVPLNSLKKTTLGAESKTIFARLLLEMGWNQKFRRMLLWKTRNSFSIYLGRQKKQATLLTYFARPSKTLIHSFHSRIVLIELSAWWKGAPARARVSFATCIIVLVMPYHPSSRELLH
jgi:hypothetical protein